MDQPIFYNKPPCILVLEYAQADVTTSYRLKIKQDEDDVELHLRGIVYHGGFHFTSQFISEEGDIWYQDLQDFGFSSCAAPSYGQCPYLQGAAVRGWKSEGLRDREWSEEAREVRE
jgi:hypothetical protein